VDTLLLTNRHITLGNRMATEIVPPGPHRELATRQLASLADETPEGRSIVCCSRRSTSCAAGDEGRGTSSIQRPDAHERLHLGDPTCARRGRRGRPREVPASCRRSWCRRLEDGDAGGTPLAVSDAPGCWADLAQGLVKGGSPNDSRASGRWDPDVMITGDNPRTAAAIAGNPRGHFLAQATPEPRSADQDEQGKASSSR